MNKFKNLSEKHWFPNAVAGCITVAFFIILSNIGTIWGVCSQIMSYFSTAIAGCVTAYLMNPLANFYSKNVFNKRKSDKTRWTLSTALTVITVVLAFTLVMSALIPQLIDSVAMFINNLGGYSASLQNLLHNLARQFPKLEMLVQSSENMLNTAVDYIVDYITENYQKIISISTEAGKNIGNFAVAFVLSVYLLSAKPSLKREINRFMKAVMPKKQYHSVTGFLKHCNLIMNQYVIFSLIDGVIIGVSNAVFMSICQMQYAGLVSVIVGLTNLIPTFGPIIGGVLGAFVLLMVKPAHALIFIIFTCFLQFFDGFILKPKLFGNTLGVSGLLILLFIIIGGKMAGIAGILLAIPTAAIVDYVYKDLLITALEKHREQVNASDLPPDPEKNA